MSRRGVVWETVGWILALAALFLAWIVASNRGMQASREAGSSDEAAVSPTQRSVGSIPALMIKRKRGKRPDAR